MGNYNTKCQEETCQVKIRKLEKDVFYCKYHRCKSLLCNLKKEDNTHWCKFHL